MVQISSLKNNCNDDDNDEGGFIPVSSIGNLEAVAHEAALADGLISDQTGKQESQKIKKAGLRRGKWTTEEEYYANRLIYEFKLGLLPLTDGTTLRTFLSKLLNCDPMRISKKFVGQNCIGKQVFRRRQQDLEKLSLEQIENSRKELAELERKFLERVAQTNRTKSSGGGIGKGPKDRTDYEDENGNAVVAPWMIPPDDAAGHFQDSKSDSVALKSGMGPRTASNALKASVPSLRSSTAQSNKGSSEESGSTLDKSVCGMNTNPKPPQYSSGFGDIPNYPYINPYQYPLNQYYGGQSATSKDTSTTTDSTRNTGGTGDALAGSISKVSSLDVLCNIDSHRFPAPLSEGVAAFPANLSLSNFGSLTNFASIYRSNYFPWANFSTTAAGSSNGVASNGELLSADSDSNELQTKGIASTSLGNFPTLIDWPSMNNLVVAAEAMKSVDDMESLGISASSFAFLAASTENIEGLLLHDSAGTSHSESNGLGAQGEDERAKTIPSSSIMDGKLSDTSHDNAKQQQQQIIDDIGYPLEDNSSLIRASALALAAHKSSNTGMNCSSLIVDATSHIYNQGQLSDLVMHPQPQIGQPLTSLMHSTDSSASDSQSASGVSPRGRRNLDQANVWGDGPTASSVINSAFANYHNAMNSGAASGFRRGQSPTTSSHDDKAVSPTSDPAFYNRSVSMIETQPLNDGSTNIGLGLDDSDNKVADSTGEIPRNSSVENFWLLVDMGDLPQPDKDVLSEEIMSTRKNDMMLAMQHHQQQQQQQQQQHQQLGLCIDSSAVANRNPFFMQQASQSMSNSPRNAVPTSAEGGSVLTQNLMQSSIPTSSAKSVNSNSNKSARSGGKKDGTSPRLNSSQSSSSQPAPSSHLHLSMQQQQMMMQSQYQQPASAHQLGQVRSRGESIDQNNVHKRSKTVEIKVEPSSNQPLLLHQQKYQQAQHYPQETQNATGNIQADMQSSLKIEWNEG